MIGKESDIFDTEHFKTKNSEMIPVCPMTTDDAREQPPQTIAMDVNQ